MWWPERNAALHRCSGRGSRSRTAKRPIPGWPVRARQQRSAARESRCSRWLRTRRRRVRSRCWGELQSALVAVAGVDGPVAARFALCEAIPVGIGGSAGGTCGCESCYTHDGAGDGDLGNSAACGGGLAMASAHDREFLSTRACEVSCRVRAERLPGLAFPGWKGSGFTPRFECVACRTGVRWRTFLLSQRTVGPRPCPWNARKWEVPVPAGQGLARRAGGGRSFPAGIHGNGSHRSCHHLITRRAEWDTNRQPKRS